MSRMCPYISNSLSQSLSCIVSEIKRDIGRKSRFFSHPTRIRRPIGILELEFRQNIYYGKIEYTNVTDGQTDSHRMTAQAALNLRLTTGILPLRSIRSMFIRSNILLRRYSKCALSLKLTVFKAYCMCRYDIGLQWKNFSVTVFHKLRILTEYRPLLRCF